MLCTLWLLCETLCYTAGRLLTLSFPWNVTQSVQSSWSGVIQYDWMIHPFLINHFVMHLDNENSTFFIINGLMVYSTAHMQVTSRVRALRGMWAREKLARAQGALEELRVKPKPLESWTIANLPAKLLLRVLAQSWYSPYIKFTSQNIVTCSYNISVPYTERDCYARASSRKSSHL